MVFSEDKGLQKVTETTKGKEKCFSTNFGGVRSLWKFKILTFSVEMAVVMRTNGESLFNLKFKLQLFVLSELFWLDWMPSQP